MKRKHSGRKVLCWGVALLAAAVLAVCLLPLPRRISQQYDALEWRCGDETYSPVRAVTIDGTYMDFLFFDDRFDGKIEVEGYPLTESELTTCRFNDGFAFLCYFDPDSGDEPALQYMGVLVMDPAGGEFAICVYEGNGWDSEDGLVLTGPARERAQAVALTNALAQRCGTDFLTSANPLT